MGEAQWQESVTREPMRSLTPTKTKVRLPDVGGGGKVIAGRPYRLSADRILETVVGDESPLPVGFQ